MNYWLRFNLVGILGMAVQLIALAILSHVMPHHLLYASAIAVELTLLHNLTWHIHYTWRDRSDSTSRLQQLLRFHLSNGLISLAGNLILMHLLLHHTHLPLLVSNLIAILTCSLANFYASHHWTFPQRTPPNIMAPNRICGPAPSSSSFV
jgi:putative flippase GtrA